MFGDTPRDSPFFIDLKNRVDLFILTAGKAADFEARRRAGIDERLADGLDYLDMMKKKAKTESVKSDTVDTEWPRASYTALRLRTALPLLMERT